MAAAAEAPYCEVRGRGKSSDRKHSLPDLGATASATGTSGSSVMAAASATAASPGAVNKPTGRSLEEKALGADFVPDDEWQWRWNLRLCQRCGAKDHKVANCPVQKALLQKQKAAKEQRANQRKRKEHPEGGSGLTPGEKKKKPEGKQPVKKQQQKWTFAQVAASEGLQLVIRNGDSTTPTAAKVEVLKVSLS